MKTIKLTNSIFQGLLMAAVVAAALPFPDLVQAAASEQGSFNLGASVGSIHEGINNIPNVVAGIFYIGGSALVGAGALKLKAHAENPVQEPLGKGLGRVGAGAALIALPAFGQWLVNTGSIGSSGSVAASMTLGTLQ